jgi:4-hydroxyphenylacetate 3-monooxygenase
MTAENSTPRRTKPQTGDEYLESLRDGREVWAYGERVKDVTTHPAFRNSARSIARLYDALHVPGNNIVVPTDTGSGGVTHPFFKVPYSSADLVDSRNAIEAWARESYGWMGRSPDYKATFLGTLGVNHELYSPFADNATRLYKEAQEQVSFWNHALINPPVDRNRPLEEVEDVFVHGVETDSGVILSGAKVVATGAAISQMNFVASGGAIIKDKKFAVSCVIPMDAPGVKFIARNSYPLQADVVGSPFDYPLSSRFDENDAIIVLDKVLVPWENILIWADTEKMNDYALRSGLGPRVALQGATRLSVKLDFIAGLLIKSLELTGTKDFRGVQARLGEVLSWRSMFWALTSSMVHDPVPWMSGAVEPNPDAVNAYRWLATVAYPRIREIVEQDLGSALIYLNSHTADFKNAEIRPLLDKYLRGSGGVDAEQRVKVLKMMWDAVGSEFANRHDLYERNYQGNHEVIRMIILDDHERRGKNKELMEFVDSALSDYDLNGWTAPDLINPTDVSIIGKGAF